jgi:L,D-transpeptidase catalytic domain
MLKYSIIVSSLMLVSMQSFAETPQSLLTRLAPEADPRVLGLALEARDCAAKELSQVPSPRLAVIDYSLPSTARRLWVFDLEKRELLFSEHVAHGQGTGENFARDFSNREGSHQSSLGVFRTSTTYSGKNGYSLKMEGLEPGVNDAAMSRAIVMHGADYVNPEAAKQQGRLGRSWGCPAVRPEVAEAVIDSLKHGQMIFAYYPDTQWLSRSPFIGCRKKDSSTSSMMAVGTMPAATRK